MGWQGAPQQQASGWAAAAPMIPTPLPQLPSPRDISDMIADVLSQRKVRLVHCGFLFWP
jgi:hypothetical protein